MKVMLLGTSAAEGWPGLFCTCQACASARKLGGRNVRTRSSSLIDDVLKIDFPPDTLYHLLTFRQDLDQLQALLITHAHDDHLCATELQYLGIHFVPQMRAAPLPVFGPEDVIRKIQASVDVATLPLRLTALDPWRQVSVSSYWVTPIVANHDPSQLCFNYIIEDGRGTALLYATDTGWYTQDAWQFLESRRLHGIVVECTKGPQEGGYEGHLGISEVICLKERLVAAGALPRGAPVVTTHFSHLGGLLHDELRRRLAPHGIDAGYDGMTFHVGAGVA